MGFRFSKNRFFLFFFFLKVQHLRNILLNFQVNPSKIKGDRAV